MRKETRAREMVVQSEEPDTVSLPQQEDSMARGQKEISYKVGVRSFVSGVRKMAQKCFDMRLV